MSGRPKSPFRVWIESLDDYDLYLTHDAILESRDNGVDWEDYHGFDNQLRIVNNELAKRKKAKAQSITTIAPETADRAKEQFERAIRKSCGDVRNLKTIFDDYEEE